MATQTATAFTDPSALALALESVAKRLREQSVGGPGVRDSALNIVTDTAGSVSFTIAARGGNPAFSAVLTATVS